MNDYGKIKSVKLKVLATAAYACIETDKRSLDVKLSPGKPAGASLRETVADLREKAKRLEYQANLIELADQLL